VGPQLRIPWIQARFRTIQVFPKDLGGSGPHSGLAELGQTVTRSQRAAGIIAADRGPSGGGDRAAAGQATLGDPAAKAKGQVDA